MDFIAIPIGWIMKWCYEVTHNYALALLLFAVFAQLILFPFGIKQQRNSQKQMMLRPQELAIRKKYGDLSKMDSKKKMETQQKMQAEINEMHQKHGYNQLAGCLPMLLTILLIFPLYGAIRNPLTYISSIDDTSINKLYAVVASADNTEAIKDVDVATAIDRLDGEKFEPKETESEEFKKAFKDAQTKGQIQLAGFLGEDQFTEQQLVDVGIDTATFDTKQLNFDLFANISLLETPSFDNWQLMFIPILVFITSVLAQMIMSKWQTPSQIGPDGKETTMPGGAVMKWGMPLMSAVFSMTFNAAIGLYWIYGNVLREGQSYIMSKLFPLKRWSQEELAAAEREYNKSKKKKKVIMIEVDEDDNSYSNLEISPELAEKKAIKSSQKQAEADALAKAAELDAELEAKAAELAAKNKSKKDSDFPQMKEDIPHKDKKKK